MSTQCTPDTAPHALLRLPRLTTFFVCSTTHFFQTRPGFVCGPMLTLYLSAPNQRREEAFTRRRFALPRGESACRERRYLVPLEINIECEASLAPVSRRDRPVPALEVLRSFFRRARKLITWPTHRTTRTLALLLPFPLRPSGAQLAADV